MNLGNYNQNGKPLMAKLMENIENTMNLEK